MYNYSCQVRFISCRVLTSLSTCMFCFSMYITSNNWLESRDRKEKRSKRERERERQVYTEDHSSVCMPYEFSYISVDNSICVGVICLTCTQKRKELKINISNLVVSSCVLCCSIRSYCCRLILCDLSKLMPEESLTNLKLLSRYFVAD